LGLLRDQDSEKNKFMGRGSRDADISRKKITIEGEKESDEIA
jgi:hypothetical protein